MRILIIHRYFFPDSPTYAFLLFKLAKDYTQYFEKVSVLTSMPSYYGSDKIDMVAGKEYTNGFYVRRLRLLPEKRRNFFSRAMNSILFGLSVFLHLVFKGGQYDVVQVATTPPIISAMAVTLASKIRKVCFVYHCQDIYPDITRIGRTDAPGTLFKLLRKLDYYIMKNAWQVVVLSGDMKLYLSKTRKIDISKVKTINNFNFNRQGTTVDNNLPAHLMDKFESKRKNIIYAGNLGYFQNLDLVFNVINKILDEDKYTFIVVGEGVKKRELQQKYTSKHIIYTGFLPNETIQRLYDYCHLGLVPVIAGIEKVAYPSKIISYTLGGLPVLTFSSHGSLIEKFIESNNMGLNYPFDGTKSLELKVKKCMEIDFDRARIKEVACMEFGEATAYNKWKAIYQG